MSRRLNRLVRRLPILVWLTLVWVLLWGTFSLKTLVFGLVVAFAITVLFPMPTSSSPLGVRPVRIASLVAYVAWDLFTSTLRVSWQAVRYGPRVKAGIVAVRTLTDSDYLTAVLSNAISLAPGKFVIQIDRGTRTCYVYSLGMVGDEREAVREEVLHLETRIVRALGTSDEVAVVDAYRTQEA